jgi:transcriptional regulator with XRE-family HTH domain
MSIGDLVHAARRSRGYTQRQLSGRSGVAQSTLSDLESGRRSPSTDTVDRLLLATGHQLISIPTRRHTAATATGEIASRLAEGDRELAVRHFIQLADDLAAVHHEVRFALTIAEPPRTGEKRWDAAVAGLVEHRLEEEGLPLPSWVSSDDRRLRRSWIFGDGVYDLPVEPDRAVPAFRRHGVLLDPATLASV